MAVQRCVGIATTSLVYIAVWCYRDSLTYCNTLQHTAIGTPSLVYIAVWCSVLQYVSESLQRLQDRALQVTC